MHLPKRPLPAQQRRRRLIPILRPAHLHTNARVRAPKPRERRVVHAPVQRLRGEAREARRVHDVEPLEPLCEAVQRARERGRLRCGEVREDVGGRVVGGAGGDCVFEVGVGEEGFVLCDG